MKGKKSIFTSVLFLSILLGGCGNAVVPNEPETEETQSSEILLETDAAVTSWDYKQVFLADPRSAYTAEEWLTEGNVLTFPFDPTDYMAWNNWQYEDRCALFYVPPEALETATTESLLEAAKQPFYMSYPVDTDLPSSYFEAKANNQYLFNALNEVMQRADMAEVVLAAYSEESHMDLKIFQDKEESNAYEKERRINQNAIILDELLLATNEAFKQTDEEMRGQIIEAVMEKEEERQELITQIKEMQDQYSFSDLVKTSGFLAYIIELHEYSEEGSKWYDYIMEEYGDEEVKEYILSQDAYWYGPLKK